MHEIRRRCITRAGVPDGRRAREAAETTKRGEGLEASLDEG
ncbi:hypothetical protein QHF85_12185 [Polyangium sp. 6x1]|nr:hypothetical protein [Polyangium sp. 6x1]